MAGRVGLYILLLCFIFFYLFFAQTYRWESANQAAAVTAPSVGPSHPLLKYRQTFHPCCPPFLQGSKMSQILAQISTPVVSDRRIFEPRRFIGKQKQTCQGPMIGLPSHQTWSGWVPQFPEPLAQWVPQKGESGNFFYILRSSGSRPAGAHQYYTSSGAPGCAHKISTDVRLMLPPFFAKGENVANFGPKYDPNRLRTAVFLNCGNLSEIKNKLGKDRWYAYHHTKHGIGRSPQLREPLTQWVSQKGKSGKFLIYPPFQQLTPTTALPTSYHLLGP